MDYKEEYEAMVQRARELHEAGNFLTKKQMEIVCPELAESEDERIRKKIIEHLEMIKEGSVICAIDTSEEIAYLEKQKERGPLTKEEERTLQDIILHLEDEGCPTKWKDLLYDIYNLPYTKQKEPHFTKRNALFDKCVAKCDPEIMQRVSDEVDENTIESIKGLITMGKFADTNTIRTIWKLLDSLRPSWKPSEEHFQALRRAIMKADKGSDAETWLIDLCEHLKKL